RGGRHVHYVILLRFHAAPLVGHGFLPYSCWTSARRLARSVEARGARARSPQGVYALATIDASSTLRLFGELAPELAFSSMDLSESIVRASCFGARDCGETT